MRKLLLLIVSVLAYFNSMACTNFLVGKAATVDGSTLISYSADSYFMFGSLYYSPAATYPDNAMLDIYEWDTGEYLGKIKQAERTYSVVGNMNEFQVSIGETTFGGRPELVDTTAILDYGSLIYIALQRSRSAREAIKVMTDLVEQYGYRSEGESFSIADPNEVWIMEMVGKGNRNKGAVWVAQRIPDDCVSAHANQARITTFPFDDKNNCLYAEDVIAFAREKGYFKGKNKDFSFSDTYAPLDYLGLRICEARVWTFFRKVDPSMDSYISYIKGETAQRMPLWIKPNRKISAQDVKEFMRDQYEGTELDITKGIGAGPFHSKLRCSPLTFYVDSVEYVHERPVATQQTGFSFVAQMRSWLPDYIGGILWFGVDDAASSIYVPMYCGINSVPECYRAGNGSLVEYSPTSAFWIYNQVANFAYSKYSFMMQDIKKVQSKWEQDFNSLVPTIDKVALGMSEESAKSFLTNFSNYQAEASTAAWKKLGEYLLVKYMDGNVKMEKDGKFLQNDKEIPPGIIRPGYPEDFLRMMVKENPGLRVKTAEELKNRK
ncbi:MAG: C69 family dipeptidase [Paludibacteraceae bacterium]|jgi:dipeptidase|nr:C69 family dipeptidase [Paludibacteraceae bacterium]HOR39921.1 C69 family dipeptidase [Paludibacteraceae bacterium]HPL77257.1 C69 family dipeptidase [Paludibacteraceae bacterium]